jgi:hypothetical protein
MDMTEDKELEDESHAIVSFYEKISQDGRVLSFIEDINNLVGALEKPFDHQVKNWCQYEAI